MDQPATNPDSSPVSVASIEDELRRMWREIGWRLRKYFDDIRAPL